MFKEEQYLKVKTVNGSPTVSPVAEIIVPNSTLDDNGNGTVTITFPSGADGITRVVASVSINTNAGSTALTDYEYFVSGTTTLTLPTAVGNTNKYSVKNTGSNTVTIATTSSQTIDGSSSITMAVPNTSLSLISDGANWRIV